jgi:predicted ester cyclase
METLKRYLTMPWQDVVEQVPLPGQGPGLEGLKDIIRAMRTGFPDLVFSVLEQISEGDKVMGRFEWTGCTKGNFSAFLPRDTLGLMKQLRVLPAKS